VTDAVSAFLNDAMGGGFDTNWLITCASVIVSIFTTIVTDAIFAGITNTMGVIWMLIRTWMVTFSAVFKCRRTFKSIRGLTCAHTLAVLAFFALCCAINAVGCHFFFLGIILNRSTIAIIIFWIDTLAVDSDFIVDTFGHAVIIGIVVEITVRGVGRADLSRKGTGKSIVCRKISGAVSYDVFERSQRRIRWAPVSAAFRRFKGTGCSETRNA
jgi:hypothetical protein